MSRASKGLSSVERKICAEGRQVIKLHEGVLRETSCPNRRLELAICNRRPRKQGRARRHTAHRGLLSASDARSGTPPRFICVAEQGFPQTGHRPEYVAAVSFSPARYGGIHRPARKFSGVLKTPGIGGRIGFQASNSSSTPGLPADHATCCAIPPYRSAKRQAHTGQYEKKGGPVCA